MLATTFDPSLGGRSFDLAIAHQLAKGFNKPGSDVTKNKRSWIRLLAEVDKLKRQMSANISSLPINIECLIDERDFSAAMKRYLWQIAHLIKTVIITVFLGLKWRSCALHFSSELSKPFAAVSRPPL